jgi:hypothetical protein
MECISELKSILGKQLDWHKSRIDFFAQALIGLMVCRTINFKQIAVSMPCKKATIDSRYRRIQRFFSLVKVDYCVIACWLFRLFFSHSDELYVAIDRTNWFFGKSKINVFMLSLCHEGIAIPIYWTLLNKAGNSTGQEQIHLIEKFIKTFGKAQIKAVLADREFPNKTFISWLNKNEIPFYMRIKQDTAIYINKKKYKSAGDLFSSLRPYQQKVFDMRITAFNEKLWLAASKNERDELMIIATNNNPKVAVATYLRRWEIESLFQAMKGRGFNFEDTHVIQLERIKRIVMLLAIAFSWAHKTGEWRAELKPIPLKTIRSQRRPQYSFFRYGLDLIRDIVTSTSLKKRQFKKLLYNLVPEQRQSGNVF